MLDATDVMARTEAAASAETLDRLRHGWRSAMTALPLIGGIFASVTLIHHHVLGLISAGMALAGILCFVVARSRVRRYAAWSTLLALWVLGYWQIASVLVGFAVFSSVASPGWTLLLAGLYLPAVAYAYRVYFRGYSAGWEKHRRFNERRALDLDAATFSGGFKVDPPATGPLESAIYQVFLPLAPVVLAGGFVLRRAGLHEADRLFGAALGLWFGVVAAQLVVQPLIQLWKLREYERQIGRRITNR